jgi:hypothetical protein
MPPYGPLHCWSMHVNSTAYMCSFFLKENVPRLLLGEVESLTPWAAAGWEHSCGDCGHARACMRPCIHICKWTDAASLLLLLFIFLNIFRSQPYINFRRLHHHTCKLSLSHIIRTSHSLLLHYSVCVCIYILIPQHMALLFPSWWLAYNHNICDWSW